jgi:hypothetical protein
MHEQEARKTLKNLYFEMTNLKIPRNIENEQLLNWMEEINELDPYYVGLALSVAEGEKVLLKELYDLEPLKKSLSFIQIDREGDKQILETFKSYLQIIEKIDFLLRKIASNKTFS